MSLDRFFGRKYNRRTYNCAHLSCDVWRHKTGREAAESVRDFLVPRGTPKLSRAEGVRIIPSPVDPCFVLMRSDVREPHVGVYTGGKVIHFAENHRVQRQPLEVATIGYSRVRFFTC